MNGKKIVKVEFPDYKEKFVQSEFSYFKLLKQFKILSDDFSELEKEIYKLIKEKKELKKEIAFYKKIISDQNRLF